jgi:hypothetical protein
MTGWGSDKVAYEMETYDPDANFERSNRNYQRKNISEDVGEW